MRNNGYTHPWNFGIKPLEYVRGLTVPEDEFCGEVPRKLAEEIIREAGGLERLDELFLHTLKCPQLRKLTPEQKEELLRGAEPFDEYDATKTLILVASHAKPSGNFKTCIPLTEEKRLGDVLSKFGISFRYYPARDQHRPNPHRYVGIGFDDAICEMGVECWEKWWKRVSDGKHNIAADKAHDIIVGILFGYPLADAFGHGYTAEGHGYASRRNSDDLSEVLQHIPCPRAWSRQWVEQVGWEGEERLARIYRDVLDN